MNRKATRLIAPDAKSFANVWLYTGVLILFHVFNAYSDSPTNEPDNLVMFFKQAISLPPDVEKYVIGERQPESITLPAGTLPAGFAIKANTIFYTIGARAGTNYYLEDFSGSNVLDASKAVSITGRSGITEYEFSQNAIIFAFGSNSLTAGVEQFFSRARQFLDMGLAEIEPESVKWNGDTFTATLDNGRFRCGELTTSNGLPSRLEIRDAKGSPPYKIIDYMYPDPPASLSGFPEKMLISGDSFGRLKPELEIQFCSVHLAATPLPDNYFAPAQFITPQILYTNIYSNSDVYLDAWRPGQPVHMVKMPASALKSGGYSNPHP